jgi:beta-lactam-binding protein with PASTA domain
VANGTVFQQNPANGTATKGSTVTIFVQTGQSPSTPPTDTATPTETPSSPTPATGTLNLNQ